MRRILSFSFVALLFLLISAPTEAHHKEILGVSTSSALPQLEATAEGPGLILPDSPLFFLDRFKQNVRLALAFSPESKARLHAEIAGERLAEFRFMLARQNRVAASVALQGISDNLRESANDVTKAQLTGRDVKKLAREINDNIKAKQKLLDAFETSATGSLKLHAAQVQENIFESKVEVEDALPSEDLENEIRDDLARRIERKVVLASDSARLLDRDLKELTKEASEAAQKSLKKREEALKKAIEKSDESLRKVQEKLLENEKKKQEALLKAQQKAAQEAQEALLKAQTAASEFKKAKQVADEIRNTPVTDTKKIPNPGSTSTNTSGSTSGSNSSGSNSGSSSSGSGSSGSEGEGSESGKH